MHKLSLIKTVELIPSNRKFIPFRPFFNKLILLAFLPLESFIITFSGSLLDFIQWIFFTLLGSTIMSNFSKMSCTVPTRALFFIVSGMLLSSKHSRLECYLLFHVCRSRATTFSLSLTFTSLVINKSDLNCSKSLFEIRKFVFDTFQCSVKFTQIIQSNTDDLSLCSFFSADLESFMIINKMNFSYLLQFHHSGYTLPQQI